MILSSWSSLMLPALSLVAVEASHVLSALIGWFPAHQSSLGGLEASTGPELSLALEDLKI